MKLFLTIIFSILAILIILGMLIYLLEKIGLKLPSFSLYRSKYPQCVDAQGNVHCRACGSRNIFVHFKDPKSSRSTKTHICQQCGKRLWYS